MINIDGLKNQVWEARKQGKKQYQIAKECKIDANRFCNIMNDKKQITLKEVNNCCLAFGCKIEDLIKVEE